MPSISETEWEARYRPVNSTILDTDSPLVDAVNPRHLWTECDDDEGGYVILSGRQSVNRIGFWITEHPWEEDIEVPRPREDDEEQGEEGHK
jgi:hypothetical protein